MQKVKIIFTHRMDSIVCTFSFFIVCWWPQPLIEIVNLDGQYLYYTISIWEASNLMEHFHKKKCNFTIISLINYTKTRKHTILYTARLSRCEIHESCIRKFLGELRKILLMFYIFSKNTSNVDFELLFELYVYKTCIDCWARYVCVCI